MNSLSRTSLLRSFSLLSVCCILSGVVFAQDNNNASTPPATPATPAASDNANPDNAGGRQRRAQNGRGNFDPAQMQERLMTALRDQMGVTDDAEWKVISDRITAVAELRRANGGFGGFALLRGGAGGGRRGMAASPEQDALRQAISDKLPDAEIKARLTHLREVRKANDEKLAKAQEDLRAVLGVRQEAVAVLFGLLP